MLPLDKQIARFKSDLIGQVGLTADESNKVATLISSEVQFLPPEIKTEISAASWVPLKNRLEELEAFQAWNKFSAAHKEKPAVVRAQVVVQNYVCFTYLKDACFEVLSRRLPPESVSTRCAKFLCRDKVRDFRNAFSHSNWCYMRDYSGLECWVAEDSRKPDGPHRKFVVSQGELDFWQTLSRGTAYATYLQLCN